ncbi:MAG: hypothetical protein ACLP8S_22405 [Solirubrobacteraceae bacterium]
MTLAAIAAALVLPSVLESAHGSIAADGVNIAYAVCDLVLLMFVGHSFSLCNGRPEPFWLLIGAGVGLMAIADSVYAVQVAAVSLLSSGLVNAMFVLAIALLAIAAWVPSGPGAWVRVRRGRSS